VPAQGWWGGGLLDAYTVKFEVGSDTIEGKFIEILRKQPDGSWRYVVDMYSSNLAFQH